MAKKKKVFLNPVTDLTIVEDSGEFYINESTLFSIHVVVDIQGRPRPGTISTNNRKSWELFEVATRMPDAKPQLDESEFQEFVKAAKAQGFKCERFLGIDPAQI